MGELDKEVFQTGLVLGEFSQAPALLLDHFKQHGSQVVAILGMHLASQKSLAEILDIKICDRIHGAQGLRERFPGRLNFSQTLGQAPHSFLDLFPCVIGQKSPSLKDENMITKDLYL